MQHQSGLADLVGRTTYVKLNLKLGIPGIYFLHPLSPLLPSTYYIYKIERETRCTDVRHGTHGQDAETTNAKPNLNPGILGSLSSLLFFVLQESRRLIFCVSAGDPVYKRNAEPEPIRFQPLGEIRREALTPAKE